MRFLKLLFASLLSTSSLVSAQTATPNGFIHISVTGNPYNFQCSNGKWVMFGYSWIFSTITSNGQLTTGSLPPMNENGACLEQLTATWLLNGAAVPLAVSSPFNFGAPTTLGTDAAAGPPTVSGNTMTFNLQDNMATPGATYTLTPPTPCTSASTAPSVTTSFSVANFLVQAPGNSNPTTIPAVNAIPTITNNLPAANNGQGGNNPTLGPTSTVTTTKAAGTTTPATTVTTPAPVTTVPPVTVTPGGFIKISVTGPLYAPRCANGAWSLDGYSWTFSTESSNGKLDVTNPPMNENGACTEQITAYWYLNGQAVPLTVNSPFNFGAPTTLGVDAVAGAPAVSGNTMVFNLQDNMATPGATFVLTPPTPCTQGSPVPTITTAFTIANFVIQAPGNGGTIPAVNAVPTIINKLQPANLAAAPGTTLAPVPTYTPKTSVAPTGSNTIVGSGANHLSPSTFNFMILSSFSALLTAFLHRFIFQN